MLHAWWRDTIAWILTVLGGIIFLAIGALHIFDMLDRMFDERRMIAPPDRSHFHEQMLQIDPVYIVPEYEQPEIPPEWRRPND